jgi:alkyl sulfatase BDS1-like metallo-beta-lactamase superfamily hydrolase
MPTELWLDYLAILADGRKAEGMRFVINLVTPDNGEKFVVEMSNSTLTSISGVQAPKADLTVTIDRADLEPVMMRKATFASQAAAGRAKLEGDARVMEQLMSCLVEFDQYFEIMPGTRSPAPAGGP